MEKRKSISPRRRAGNVDKAEPPSPEPRQRPGSQGASRPRETKPEAEGPNIRAKAARLLTEIQSSRQALKRVLQREQLRLQREDDRALLRELVAGVIRTRPLLDFVLERFTRRGLAETEAPLVDILRVGAYQILFLDRVPAYAAVHQCVEAAKSLREGAGGFANGILRSVGESGASILAEARELPGPEGLALRLGMPLWLVDRYARRFSDAETLLAAYQRPAPASLYFPDAAREIHGLGLLHRDGIALEKEPVFDRTYRVISGNPLDSEAFASGTFYLMDPASQVPALLLPVKRDSRVLDLCAAPGGKTVVLSGRVPEGRVVSSDVKRGRLELIRENLRRLQISNVDLAQVNAGLGLPFREAFSAVLLDAPCSSLGTLRKNPEIRWQIQEGDVGERSSVQASFLAAASRAVVPGGYLLYAVCSIEEEETTAVADGFLSEHSDFCPEAIAPPKSLVSLLEGAGEGRAFLLPHRYPWDGFFVALFRRQP